MRGCYRHLFRIGFFSGLQTKSIRHRELVHRLWMCWQHRTEFPAFQIKPEYWSWFRLNARPSVDDDALGIYATRPNRESLLCPIMDNTSRRLVDMIAGEGSFDMWGKEGTLIVNHLFGWLCKGLDMEPGIATELLEEFDMYEYHQRERNGTSNKGWLRTMVYSLSQQIIRQDIVYWA